MMTVNWPLQFRKLLLRLWKCQLSSSQEKQNEKEQNRKCHYVTVLISSALFFAVFAGPLSFYKWYSKIGRVAEKGKKINQRQGTVSIQGTAELDSIIQGGKGTL